jgi:hypothetical protein
MPPGLEIIVLFEWWSDAAEVVSLISGGNHSVKLYTLLKSPSGGLNGITKFFKIFFNRGQSFSIKKYTPADSATDFILHIQT